MNTPEPVFALIDCNSFYASCERIFRPDLAKTPIVVLGNKDGCVIEGPYILSVLVTGADWQNLDFARLNVIDPAAALDSLEAEANLDRSARFCEIEPYDMTMLW